MCCPGGTCVPAKRGVVCNSCDMWQVSLAVPDYQPDELCVTVQCDGTIEVRGEKTQCCPDVCAPCVQKFSERYCLPPDVDTCSIRWEYTGDCRLVISACKKSVCCSCPCPC